MIYLFVDHNQINHLHLLCMHNFSTKLSYTVENKVPQMCNIVCHITPNERNYGSLYFDELMALCCFTFIIKTRFKGERKQRLHHFMFFLAFTIDII